MPYNIKTANQLCSNPDSYRPNSIQLEVHEVTIGWMPRVTVGVVRCNER